MFVLISIIVPILLIFFTPKVLRKWCKSRSYSEYRWILYLACFLFFISWYLPSPLIDGQDTSFVTHFVGGGIFTTLYYLYIKYSLGLKIHWLYELLIVYALVSALGNINELVELFMVKVGLVDITLTDTNWDILANTIGVFSAYLIYKARKLKI